MTTLGYWNVRGLGQPIRYLLEYMKIDYTNKAYDDVEEWFNKDKQEQTLKTNFPNLPYYDDGQTVITESLKHKKFELIGSNPDGSFNENEFKVLQIMEVARDFRNAISLEIRKPTFKEDKDKLYTEKFSVVLDRFKKQLGDQQYLVGNLTYADFLLYEVLQYFKMVYPNIAVMTEFVQRFENIPQIKEYLSSNRFIKEFLPDRIKHLYFF